MRAEEYTLPCVLPESIFVITFLSQNRLQTRDLLKGFKIMVHNAGRLSPAYIAIRNLIISRFPGPYYMVSERIWRAANMTCGYRGCCVSRMRLVRVAILLLISSAFIFTTVTMSTMQAGAESCAGINTGDKNVVVAAQVIPTGGSIQSHNGKYQCPERLDSWENQLRSKCFQVQPVVCCLSVSSLLISGIIYRILFNDRQSTQSLKLNRLHILLRRLYLSGMWLGVAPSTDTKKTRIKESGLHVQNMITFLGSIVHLIAVTYYMIM